MSTQHYVEVIEDALESLGLDCADCRQEGFGTGDKYIWHIWVGDKQSIIELDKNNFSIHSYLFNVDDVASEKHLDLFREMLTLNYKLEGSCFLLAPFNEQTGIFVREIRSPEGMSVGEAVEDINSVIFAAEKYFKALTKKYLPNQAND